MTKILALAALLLAPALPLHAQVDAAERAALLIHRLR